MLVASSGLHANGASLARKIAESLPDGYATRMESVRHWFSRWFNKWFAPFFGRHRKHIDVFA